MSLEGAHREVDVVVRPAQLRGQVVAEADAQGGIQHELVAAEEASALDPGEEAHGPAPVRVHEQEEAVVVVLPGRHVHDAGEREGLEQPLVATAGGEADLRAVPELDFAADGVALRFLVAVEVPEAVVEHARAELLDPALARRAEAAPDVAVELAVAGAAEETDLGVEVLADLGIAETPAPERGTVAAVEAETMVPASEAGGFRSSRPARDVRELPDADLAVDGVGPVVVTVRRQRAGALAVDDQHAGPAPVAVLAAKARDREVVAVDVPQVIRLHVQETDVESTGPAGQAGAAEDRHGHAAAQADPPAEEEFRAAPERGPAADAEETGVLQEEGPLFGEEQAEAVEIDLLIVGFHLGEVRVDGQVKRQARGDAVLEVHADVAVVGAALHVVAGRAQDVRSQLEIALAGRFHADQVPGFRHPEQVVLAAEMGPERRFVLAPDVALEVQAPDRAARSVPETAEGNRHLGAPAVLAAHRSHRPGRVPVQVGAARTEAARGTPSASTALVRELAVVLDSRDVRAEDEAVLPVAEGVQDDAEAVLVLEPGVAAAVGDRQGGGLPVEADDGDVEGGVVEGDPHLGPFARRFAFERLHLLEAGAEIDVEPELLAEDVAVDDRRLRETHRL